MMKRLFSLTLAAAFLLNSCVYDLFAESVNIDTLRTQASLGTSVQNDISTTLKTSSSGVDVLYRADNLAERIDGFISERREDLVKSIGDHSATTEIINLLNARGVVKKLPNISPAPIYYVEDYQKDDYGIANLKAGKLCIQMSFAGAGTRMATSLNALGISLPQSRDYRLANLDIWKIVKFMAQKLAQDAELEGRDPQKVLKEAGLFTEYPEMAIEIGLSERHMLALEQGMLNLESSHALKRSEVDEIRKRLKFVINVSDDINEEIHDMFLAPSRISGRSFFGLEPENIVFVNGGYGPGFKLNKEGRIIASKDPHYKKLSWNHGYSFIEFNWIKGPYAYTLTGERDNDGKDVTIPIKKSVFDYIQEKGAEFGCIHRVNDLVLLHPKMALDVSMFGAFLNLRSTEGINAYFEVVANPTGQKGGLALSEDGKHLLLIEKLATQDPRISSEDNTGVLDKIAEEEMQKSGNKRGIPYNRLYGYYRIADMANSFSKSGMPLSIKYQDGIITPEIPIGDTTWLEDMKVLAGMRRKDILIESSLAARVPEYDPEEGALIHDCKTSTDILAALKMVKILDASKHRYFPERYYNDFRPIIKSSSAGIYELGAISVAGSDNAGQERVEFDRYVKPKIEQGFATALFDGERTILEGDITVQQEEAIGGFWDAIKELREPLRKEFGDFDIIIIRAADSSPLLNIISHPGRRRNHTYIDGRYLDYLADIYDTLSEELQHMLISIILEAFKHEAKTIELENKAARPNMPPPVLSELWVDKYAPAFRARILFRVLYAKLSTGADKISIERLLEAINFIKKTTATDNNHGQNYISYLYAVDNMTPDEHIEIVKRLIDLNSRAGRNIAQYHIGCVLYYVYIAKKFNIYDEEKGLIDEDTIRLRKEALDFLNDLPYEGVDGEEYDKWQFAQFLIMKVARSINVYKYADLGINSNVMNPDMTAHREFIVGDIDNSGDSSVFPARSDQEYTTLSIAFSYVEKRLKDKELGFSDEEISAWKEQGLLQDIFDSKTGRRQTRVAKQILAKIGDIFKSDTVMTITASGKGTRFASLKKEEGRNTFTRLDDREAVYTSTDFSSEFRTEINGTPMLIGVVTSDVAKGVYKEQYAEEGLRSFIEIFIAQIYGESIRTSKPPLDCQIYTSFLTDKDVRKDLTEELGYRSSSSDRNVYTHTLENMPNVRVIYFPNEPLFQKNSDGFIGEMYSSLGIEDKIWPDGHDGPFVESMFGTITYSDKSYKFDFISNVDNRAAIYDPVLVGMLYLSGKAILNEVCNKVPGQKGGSITAYDLTKTDMGRYAPYVSFNKGVILEEGFQMHPKADQADLRWFPLFNSANYVRYIPQFVADVILKHPTASSEQIEAVLHKMRGAKSISDTEYHRLRFEYFTSRYKAQTVNYESDKRNRLSADQPANLAGNFVGIASTLVATIPTGKEGGKLSRFEPQKTRFDNTENVTQAIEFMSMLKNMNSLIGEPYKHLPLSAIRRDLEVRMTNRMDNKIFQLFCELEYHIKSAEKEKEELKKTPDEVIQNIKEESQKAKESRERVIAKTLNVFVPATYAEAMEALDRNELERADGLLQQAIEEVKTNLRKDKRLEEWVKSTVSFFQEQRTEVLAMIEEQDGEEPQNVKSSSAGIKLSADILMNIETTSKLAANVAKIGEGGTIVFNDTSLSDAQRAILESTLGKDTQQLKELEDSMQCIIRLRSQLTSEDISDRMIIISDEKLAGYEDVKYLEYQQLVELDNSYIPVLPMIAMAKGLLNLTDKTQIELINAISALLRNICKRPIAQQIIEDFIISGVFRLQLPKPEVFDYNKLENMHRQALLTLIAA